MRFIVLVKATEEIEAGKLTTAAEIAEMGKFNEELMKAGVMLSGEGLSQSREGARLNWSKSGVAVVDGPFTESKELVAGFWIIETKSRAEAIEWMRRAPFPAGSSIEVRRIADASDFAPDARELIAEQEKRFVEMQKSRNAHS